MLREKRNFIKGLNGDSSQRLLEAGEYLNLMNGRVAVTEFGRWGRVENVPGTTSISQSVFPPYGTSLTIGAVADTDRNRILFFNQNSLGFHGIYCLDYSSPTSPVIYAVLYDTQVTGGLDFSKSYRIDRDAGVVGDLLYWTDNLNQPRRINIEAGIKMNHAAYSTTVTPYSYPMNESVLTIIRRPFGLGLTATKVTDGAITENFLKDFSGQFASMITYRDGEETITSLPSAMLNYNYATGTFNAVDAVFDINEDFDQDVQMVDLLVRYNNEPSYFRVRRWDKAVAADAAAIAAHNAGSTALTYRFYNDKLGVAVGQAQSVKPEDPIPVTAKTLTLAINRLFLGNYVKGYTTPVQTSLQIDTFQTSSADPTNAVCYKAFSSYQISIRFRDYYSRKSAIVTNDNCVFNIGDRNFDITSYITSVSWILSNISATTEIPDWAYYYDILITKNLRTRYFISGRSFTTQYAIKNNDGTFNYQNTYTGDAYGIGINPLLLENVGYAYNPGDLCRIYISGSATVTEVPVLEQDGGIILVGLANLGDLSVQPNIAFEIYTPYKKSENEAFYTTGNTYLVTNPGTVSRTYSTTTGTIAGDIYREKLTTSLPFLTITTRCESMSPNNKVNVLAWFNFYGQIGIQSSLGQVNKTNFVMWSNTKIQGTQTNGLSTFDSADERSIAQSAGDITKLQVASKTVEEGSVLLAICEKETASIYLGEVQLVGASKTAFVASSPEVFGTANILKGNFGSKNKESVIEYLGMVFFLDILNGCFVQYSSAGLEPVSRYNMSRFFQRYCGEYLEANANNLDNINGFHHIPTCIDPFHKEVICTLPGLIYENYATTLPSYSSVPSYATSIVNRFDIFDQLGKTMAYKLEENVWGNNFQYMAEQYAYLQNTLFAFKNGAPHTHNTNITNWNTFYGTAYPLRLCFTGNLNPSLIKDLFNISIEGSGDKPNYTVALAAIPNQQITDLAYDDEAWVNNESVWEAAFLMDRLSPNASGTADQKLFTGDNLKDYVVFVMCEWQSYTGLIYINFINLGYSQSKGQKNLTDVINP